MLEGFSKFYNFFFLIVVIFYNFFPKKIRPILLLLESLLFFYLMSSKLIVCLLLTIVSIYLSALGMDQINDKKNNLLVNAEKNEKKKIKKKYKRNKQLILVAGILFNFSFLLIFKYLNFFTINVNYLLELLKFNYQFSALKLIAPIGISFYTLQALSYMFDVYNEKIKADKNIFRFALFTSFFPQIMEGPMARYSDTAYELYNGNKITYENFCLGSQRIVWGLFKKIVIADRLNILVKTVFDNYSIYSGGISFLGALGYTIMLYMEFSSTMDVVLGIGEMFGVRIPENFRQPFFSKNISEFWTRWHISLGLWFKDYIYYPISLSKPLKKLTSKARKVVGNYFGPLISGTIALFVVWFLNGLWHGAGWTFILFGLYHFILIFSGNVFGPLLKKLYIKIKFNTNNIAYRIFQSLKVCFFVIIGELIFRSPTVDVAMIMIKKIFTSFNFELSEIATLGLDVLDYIVILIALIIVFIVGILKEKKIFIRGEIAKKPIYFRWAIFYILIFSVIIFGAYGPGYEPVNPIYADF